MLYKLYLILSCMIISYEVVIENNTQLSVHIFCMLSESDVSLSISIALYISFAKKSTSILDPDYPKST